MLNSSYLKYSQNFEESYIIDDDFVNSLGSKINAQKAKEAKKYQKIQAINYQQARLTNLLDDSIYRA